MNDDDVITTVREPFAGVRMRIPVEAVTARARAECECLRAVP